MSRNVMYIYIYCLMYKLFRQVYNVFFRPPPFILFEFIYFLSNEHQTDGSTGSLRLYMAWGSFFHFIYFYRNRLNFGYRKSIPEPQRRVIIA